MYPVQRHRFPARYSLISSIEGFFNSRNIASTFIMNPGEQNPHCSAPSCARNEPNSAASFSTPSSVVTSCPSMLAARTEHDRRDFPSIHTVHKPQFVVSHPHFTLLHPRSRRRFNRTVSAAISVLTFFPFRVNCTSILFLLRIIFI